MKQSTKIIIILSIITIVALVGMKIGNHPSPSQEAGVTVLERDSQGRATLQTRSTDPSCPLPDAQEFGGKMYEHISYGDLQPGKSVQITVSCDQRHIRLGGAVTQDIAYTYDTQNMESIALENDYNFDGYNDVALVRIAKGSGGDDPDTQYTTDVYLYDPMTTQFIYAADLSKLKNITVDPELKYVVEDESYYTKSGEHVEAYQNYRWVNGRIVKVME